MNFHPLVVHFPVVCLTLYSLVEVISLIIPKWGEKLKTTKYLLLFFGVATARAALQTGQIAEEIMGRSDLVHMHEEYAEKTYMTYIIIAVIYIIQFLVRKFSVGLPEWINTIATHRWIRFPITLLAMIGMTLLSITGSLGAAISHGKSADIIVETVYNLVMGN